ncbi:MAG: hypothetical protein COX07_00580 [Bacteroidetes bacterium CG23_combo_of_CG06-09_8_20_14_all_32_9]|nr:MAG: hypothetical protein COX07_00580 [Bacteroidetes bacterium CG23_combo_of_CG06-09_8_20_14_all_32_9]
MKNFKFLILLFILFAIICSCNKNVPPKIIEEHDPIIKILEEHDSIRIIRKDTTKVKPANKN